MTNMSYCRFENTMRALDDCYQEMLEMQEEEKDYTQLSSEHEQDAFFKLMQMCKDIVTDCGDWVQEQENKRDEANSQ